VLRSNIKNGRAITDGSGGAVDTHMLHALRNSDTENPAPNAPISRLGQSKEIDNVVIFLLSDETNFVTGSALGGRWRRKCLKVRTRM
jgi:NAD(P)-dependent dehydrogenase (short-subunit alcohol dehydrogenase family)